jgi:Helicase conserved C-terminal domain
MPTFRYDIIDAVKDHEGPFLCTPKIYDIRSEITTKALEESGWTVIVNEQEESFKVKDLERKIFTPERNRVMCESFLKHAQRDPSGELGKSIIFAVNQTHATALTKILDEIQPNLAVTITSRILDASSIAKDFRDGKRQEKVAVSVDMLSTGYNCRDLLNVVLMRPIFSPTEYIQIKGRGTRLFTFRFGNTEYKKEFFFLMDFCAVAEYFEEKYDYSVPLPLPRPKANVEPVEGEPAPVGNSAAAQPATSGNLGDPQQPPAGDEAPPKPPIPIWTGRDIVASEEVRIIGPNGEKVDVMTFRGSFERDVVEFAKKDPHFKDAVEEEDDDAIETILQEGIYTLEDVFANPLSAGDAAVIGAAFVITLAAMLLFFLIKPGKRPRMTSQGRAPDSAAPAVRHFFDPAPGAARQDNLRNNLAYQRFYVDHSRIRP